MDIVGLVSEATEQPRESLEGIRNLSEVKAWDSLAILNFIALTDKKFGITLSAEKLLGCEKIEDLANLLAPSVKSVA